ncbi:imidazolonepropionase-like amidohydrolase [Palleronia aestuarii]|uniref:Imidazolonepropionase-like amidohydrolase n=1 Tax=Palleronia aestuarii TaxID=568105 RepID=A0A2W7NHF7_9RHOB|nr:amidohydrolase family protein [Palleronia aestuarii]PZX19871.1 imidazolonepropionase-like amidohydrolase [Palleronia aestuarii]
MTQFLFRNFHLLDPERDEVVPGHELLVEDGVIREVSEGPIRMPEANVIDCAGGTLMPGLIDCHVHVVLSEVFLPKLEAVPLTLMTAKAMVSLRAMLDRGFTTVRDTGGADWGIRQAVEEGLIAGPRLFVAGRSVGPTGGHNDGRRRTDFGTRCPCCDALSFVTSLADGTAEVRKAVREEMRQGCDHVKIMMSGGVASPYDPLDSLQFSMGEVRAAVEEAEAFGRYVCAHAYSPEAITRAAEAGVRTIEHGNLIDEASAGLMADKDMFLVANLVAYYAMKERAAEFGMSGEMLEKNDAVIEGGLRSLEICQRAGVPVAYGSDLLGQLQADQSREFRIRSEVVSPIEIIRSATTIAAKVLRQEGRLGCLQPGAHADILVVEGDPLGNLDLLAEQGRHMSVIMKGGTMHKCTLDGAKVAA